MRDGQKHTPKHLQVYFQPQTNRYTNDQKDLLSETEDMLGLRMAGLIPNDYGTASEALDHGKPLTIMASRTTIGQWYLRGTEQLIGEDRKSVV